MSLNCNARKTMRCSAGFECEEVQLGEQPLQVWDLQGEPAKGLPRHHYYADMSAVVFFVDSADSDRFEGSARALREILASPRLPASAVLLVLANKQDKPNAHSVDQIQEVLSLDSLSDREWHIAACTATDVTSVQESLGWLGTQVLK